MPTDIFRRLAVGATLLAATVAGAAAEPISRTGQPDDDWRYTAAIYAFLPARTNGTSTVAGSSVPLDLNLSDAAGLLEYAAAGRFEAWRGDFGVIFDANYVQLDANGTLPTPAGATFNADIRQKWFGILGAYKAVDTINANGQRVALDLQAGARYNKLRQEITLNTPAPTPTLGGDPGWWEPVVGARGMLEINDRWAAVASIDLGGFGAGGNDLQVGANIGFDWKPWDKTSLFFGYRYYSIDYSTTLSTGPFAYDVRQHGPVFGVKFRL